jgi:hypothetical protein
MDFDATAFRAYALAQVGHADAKLVDHQATDHGLCRCGRVHPCHEFHHWSAVRGHFSRFDGILAPADHGGR